MDFEGFLLGREVPELLVLADSEGADCEDRFGFEEVGGDVVVGHFGREAGAGGGVLLAAVALVGVELLELYESIG